MTTTGRLQRLLSDHQHRQIHRDYPGVEIYFLPDIHAYLKIGDIQKNSHLQYERNALDWLVKKIEVPRVLAFDIINGFEYLLISEIAGEPYSEQLTRAVDRDEILGLARSVGGHIRRLHDLSIEECVLDQRLNAKLKMAEENLLKGFVDESDFDADNIGKSGRQVLDELLMSMPTHQDLVFTHGDLCLPNIIIRNGDLAGFIDLDRGGVADRYHDIALFIRSFSANSVGAIDIEEAFCLGYGFDTLDRHKMDFYRKLDELF